MTYFLSSDLSDVGWMVLPEQDQIDSYLISLALSCLTEAKFNRSSEPPLIPLPLPSPMGQTERKQTIDDALLPLLSPRSKEKRSVSAPRPAPKPPLASSSSSAHSPPRRRRRGPGGDRVREVNGNVSAVHERVLAEASCRSLEWTGESSAVLIVLVCSRACVITLEP